ncbi:unnamed protein product [Urochloa humidicola]
MGHGLQRVITDFYLVTGKGDKYKDEEPTALDLFKECHFNRKKASSLLYNQQLTIKV